MKWAKDLLSNVIQIAPLQKFLIVEGPEDQITYERWLIRLDPAAVAKVQVEQPGNKGKVLEALDWLKKSGGDPPNVFGLVDRDAWTADEMNKVQADLPRLRVNADRHTIENYFTDPSDIEAALFHRDKEKYQKPSQKLRTQINAARQEWVTHWALWCTLQRVWFRLHLDENFPNAILDQHPLPTDNQIGKQLRTWAKILNVRDLLAAYKIERDQALGKTHHVQFRSCVHGKDFFNQVVKTPLCQCDPSIHPDSWIIRLIEWQPEVPADLKALLQDLLA